MSDVSPPPPTSPPPKQHSFGGTATAGLVPQQTTLPPPTRQEQLIALLHVAWWNARLIYRWLRPRARPHLIAARMQLIAAAKVPIRPLFKHSNWQKLAQMIREGSIFALGWLLWYWRRLKTNRDTRLATLGLIGGCAIPVLVIAIVLHFAPLNPPPLELPIDPTVPVPNIAMIEAAPDDTEAEVTLPVDRTVLTADNFRFELFVQRAPDGNLRLLSRAAEGYILRWFPLGTPATKVMQFLGQSWIRGGLNAASAIEAAKSRCIALPIGRVFRQNTITCTYGHTLPGPALPHENTKLRMFWIVSLTNDSAGRLTDLRVHARTTEAQE